LLAEEEEAAFQAPPMARIPPKARGDAAAGALIRVQVAAAKEDGRAGAESAESVGVPGSDQRRGGGGLHPPQQGFAADPKAAGHDAEVRAAGWAVRIVEEEHGAVAAILFEAAAG